MDDHAAAAAESINPRHKALIDRLSARRSGSATGNGSANPVADFLASFASSKHAIEQSLSECRTLTDLDRIPASIASLDQLLAQNSYHLPSYELRSCLKSVADLRSAYESASQTLAPRKKFSFRNKAQQKKDEVKKVDNDTSISTVITPESKNDDEKSNNVSVRDGPGFRNRKNETLVKDFRQCDIGLGDFTLSDLENCRVYLKGRVRALFFHRIRNCQVFTGPVTGSVLIEDVSDSVLMLASHQIRIHLAKNTDFYLRVRSRPIIEDSSGVRFAPYRLVYDGIEEELRESALGEETGNWANVDDFKWLRAKTNGRRLLMFLNSRSSSLILFHSFGASTILIWNSTPGHASVQNTVKGVELEVVCTASRTSEPQLQFMGRYTIRNVELLNIIYSHAVVSLSLIYDFCFISIVTNGWFVF